MKEVISVNCVDSSADVREYIVNLPDFVEFPFRIRNINDILGYNADNDYTDSCALKAISIFTDTPIDEVYDELAAEAKCDKQIAINIVRNIKKVLLAHDFTVVYDYDNYIKFQILHNVLEDILTKYKNCMVMTDDHMFAIKKGIIYDTFVIDRDPEADFYAFKNICKHFLDANKLYYIFVRKASYYE